MHAERGGETMSVNEQDVDLSTEEGPCPFVIHGLTGSEVENMTYNARVATALGYFRDGGSVLAYRRSRSKFPGRSK